MKRTVKKYKLHRYVFCLLFLIITSSFSIGQSSGSETIVVREGQSVRDIAKEYLNDANLWQEILKENNFSSVTDVKAGMRIKIPANVILLSQEQIDKALELIKEAGDEGAEFFVPDIIGNAINTRDRAIEQRKAGNWQQSINLAIEAQGIAERAKQQAIANKEIDGEAKLNDKRGTVEGRRSSDVTWDNTPLYAILVEGQKVRTLSESYAEIKFMDESRLRLNQNSQAVIQQMKVNLLENKQESKVNLVEGDIYALLTGNPKKKVNVEVEGMDADFQSKNFWVNKSDNDIKVANYEGEISVSAGGSTVMVGKNKGTKIRTNGRPMNPEDLLASPGIIYPPHNSNVYKTAENKNILFEWEEVPGAVGYWIEIGYDKSSFSQMVVSTTNVNGNRYSFGKADLDGAYYWRVASIDKNGFPGAMSDPKLVKILTDESLPYILIKNPKEREIYREKTGRLEGETEGDATLKINGTPVDVNAAGQFSFDFSLEEDINEFEIEVTDRAGNVNTVVRSVVYVPFRTIDIRPDSTLAQTAPNYYKAKNAGFTLSGRTDPESKVEVESKKEEFKARTFSGRDEGDFAVSVPLKEEKNEFGLKIQTPAGYEKEDKFTVEVDLTPPDIILNQKLPEIVKESQYYISGTAEEAIKLVINGEEVPLNGTGSFGLNLFLEPGKNIIEINAVDIVGNKSVLKEKIIFDNLPPELINYSTSVNNVSGGDIVEITAEAEDVSELKRAAPYTVSIGGIELTGYLRYNKALSEYRHTFTVPENISGRVTILKIVLEDYFGNRKEFNLN